MHAAVAAFELHFGQSQSLKEKRAQLRPLVEGLANRFSISVAETDFQDLWQRSQIGVAVVSSTPALVAQVLDDVERFVWSFPELEVTGTQRHWLEIDS